METALARYNMATGTYPLNFDQLTPCLHQTAVQDGWNHPIYYAPVYSLAVENRMGSQGTFWHLGPGKRLALGVQARLLRVSAFKAHP